MGKPSINATKEPATAPAKPRKKRASKPAGERKAQQIAIRLAPEEMALVKTQAHLEDTTVSKLVRRLLDEYMAGKSPNNHEIRGPDTEFPKDEEKDNGNNSDQFDSEN